MSGGDWKAMFKAVQDNDIELVIFYVRLGIDVNYQHPEFMALPLVESIRFNNIEITKVLLENKAKPLLKEVAGGESALSLAKKNKDLMLIELLNKYC